ncbi:MAG: hypothetical protein J0I41_09295 [Filimonas sp.]|nr:hypothetical protein [Filimonas sp.]
MNNTLVIFIRAVGIYLALTLPAMAIPPMYLLSALYACLYGWIAWLLFTLVYIGLKQCTFSARRVLYVLAFAIFLGVLLAFQLMEVFKTQSNIWQSGIFLLFPSAAVVAGWISLYISREDVKLDFMVTDYTNEEKENQ